MADEALPEETPAEDEDTELETGAEEVAEPGTKKKRGRLPTMPGHLWIQIRNLYETGDYTQRALSDWVRAKGYSISQSAIARKAMTDGWVKGSILEEVTKSARDEHKRLLGDKIAKMLEEHNHEAKLVRAEVFQHFKNASAVRPTSPGHIIPAGILQTLVQTYKIAQEMEARSVGWSYKEGAPFKAIRENANDEENKPQELMVRVMTPEEEEAVRRAAEDAVMREFS